MVRRKEPRVRRGYENSQPARGNVLNSGGGKDMLVPSATSKVEKRRATENVGEEIRRILLVRHPFDGHDRGFRIVARTLMDAGFEVIPASMLASEIAKAAVEEDPDIIGYRITSGAPVVLIKQLQQEFRKIGLKMGIDIPVVVGGIVYDEEIPLLKKMGVAAVMGPGTSLNTIVEFFKGVHPKAKTFKKSASRNRRGIEIK